MPLRDPQIIGSKEDFSNQLKNSSEELLEVLREIRNELTILSITIAVAGNIDDDNYILNIMCKQIEKYNNTID